jgi:superfamily I DNA and/or RNA helicase
MEASLAERVRISSVDGFQGQEADVVVLTTVRCDGPVGLDCRNYSNITDNVLY